MNTDCPIPPEPGTDLPLIRPTCLRLHASAFGDVDFRSEARQQLLKEMTRQQKNFIQEYGEEMSFVWDSCCPVRV